MMTLRHDGILHRRQNLPIGCDPCANQLRSLRQSVTILALQPYGELPEAPSYDNDEG